MVSIRWYLGPLKGELGGGWSTPSRALKDRMNIRILQNSISGIPLILVLGTRV